MLKPVEKQRVAEGIVEQLRALILSGKFAPGDKLPPERGLAKQLGVNRSSLREALKKLEHLGLVRIRQGDGTRVQDFMQTAGIDLISHLIPAAEHGHVEILRDVLEFRRIYGREVARLAAERARPEDIADLERLAAETDAAAGSPEEVLRLDFEFYVTLTRASGNRVLTLLINTTRKAVMAYAPFFARFTVSADNVRRHHRGLIEAVRKRDGAEAAKIADGYMARGAEFLLEAART